MGFKGVTAMDQRGFNDTSEDFILFKSRVLSFEGRDGPAIRGMTFISS